MASLLASVRPPGACFLSQTQTNDAKGSAWAKFSRMVARVDLLLEAKLSFVITRRPSIRSTTSIPHCWDVALLIRSLKRTKLGLAQTGECTEYRRGPCRHQSESYASLVGLHAVDNGPPGQACFAGGSSTQ